MKEIFGSINYRQRVEKDIKDLRKRLLCVHKMLSRVPGAFAFNLTVVLPLRVLMGLKFLEVKSKAISLSYR